MAITRSQIARQLLAEGGVSLDDAKMMAPEGEFLAYINPKEAKMLKQAGGSGIMTPMGIPSFVEYGGAEATAGASASQDQVDSFSGGGDNDPGPGPKGPPGGPGGDRPTYDELGYITQNPYGRQVTDFGRNVARGTASLIGGPVAGFTVNQMLSKEQEKQKDLQKAIQGGQQFFGKTPQGLTTQFKQTTGMKTGPSGPPGGGGGDSPIIPRLPQVASLPTDIETPRSDLQKSFDVRFFLDPRFAAAEGGEVDPDTGRQMYGLGSFVKKAVRGVKKAVKKITKSPLGKAALAGAAIYGLGGGAAFGGKGFAFGNLPGAGAVSNFFSGGGGKASSLFGKAKDALGGNVGLGILGASVAGGLMTPKQEEDELSTRISKETGIPIAQIRKEVQDATAQGQDALDALSVKYPFLTRADSAKLKKGGRIGAEEGGLMSLGGMEMDLRGGGFVPLGKAEKADDVPARLSKNEFVFTADAVRAAGGGSVDKGADLMYKTMKQLEDRVA
jgi:hypothetical protein